MTDDQVINIRAGDLRDLIAEGVAQGLENCPAGPCPIPKEAREELVHLFGMVKDVGDGKIDCGVEVIRQNHKFTLGARDILRKTARKAYFMVIAALCTGLGGLIYLGIIHFKG